ELKRGEALSIIEVNGAGSEPTHMYDPRHSIFFAWKEIVRHWFILWRISRMNHRKGHPYLSLKEGIAMFREDKAHSLKLAEMPE
ncbi:MAG: D-alanine--D-alanine ligase, partial [Chitinophagaceae bacterium]|nr:D-alanine--D-alanine ligase [Chitinophagaceae bacterium]